MANGEIFAHSLIQIAVILCVCRLVGILLRCARQPQVVGEMVAGVLLGPALLGLILPDLQRTIFPAFLAIPAGSSGSPEVLVSHPSMTVLYSLSQLGIILFMFVIGLQFDASVLADSLKQATAISLAGVFVPLIAGGILGLTLSNNRALFPSSVSTWQAVVFIAATMSVTAFPVLARILLEHGMLGTRIATISIAAAAVCDVTAWLLLAAVIASDNGSVRSTLMGGAGAVAYVAVMFSLARALLNRLERGHEGTSAVAPTMLTGILALVLVCSWLTDRAGIHSIFGAFVVGLVMPRGSFAGDVRRAIEPLVGALFLPIFFVYAGLSTRLDVFAQPEMLKIAVIVITVAILCKVGACSLAARATGMSWRNGLAIGSLMNARGLMELVFISIGLETGLISRDLYSILVAMTIVTTLAASPLFRIFQSDAMRSVSLPYASRRSSAE